MTGKERDKEGGRAGPIRGSSDLNRSNGSLKGLLSLRRDHNRGVREPRHVSSSGSDMTPPPPRHLAQSREPISGLEMELKVPGSAHYLQTIRTVVGRAGHLLGFSFDGIEDLALATDEASSLLIEGSPTSLCLSFESLSTGGLEVHIVTADRIPNWPPDNLLDDTRWQILSALSEKVWPITGETSGIGLSQSTR